MTVIFNRKNYVIQANGPERTIEVDATTLPSDYIKISISCDEANPDGIDCRVGVEGERDGEWIELLASGTNGKPAIDPDGNIDNWTTLGFTIPPDIVNLRGMVNTNISFRVELIIEAL